MPDWTAPFHMPTFTDDEFTAAHDKIVAEKGYTITFPALSDIIHVGQPNPMTETEKASYKKKDFSDFSPGRLEEIKEMKWKKKQRYLAMLQSPTPEVVKNAGSILTSLDDAQDAISTIGLVGRIACHFAPRILGKIFLGPVGWLLTANDILNLISLIGRLGMMPMYGKRGAHACTAGNPFNKKAKASRARKLMRWKPTKGDVIEALQTTDQVFGVGLCLGPIVGLVQDIASGGIRMAMGEKVTFKKTPTYRPRHESQAYKTIKSCSVLHSALWNTDDSILLESYFANYLAHQTIMPVHQAWNPLDTVNNLMDVETLAPQPTDPLTLEIMEELKTPVSEFTGWPHNGQQWANVSEIMDAAEQPAAENVKRFVGRNNNSWTGYAGGALACDAATYMLANIEGEDQIKYDYSGKSKIAGNILQAGYYPDPDQDPGRLAAFENYLINADEGISSTSTKAVLGYCKQRGIKLVTFP